jgi:hypothetical protein
MKGSKRWAAVAFVLVWWAAPALAQDETAYAAQLWQQLVQQRLVGPQAMGAVPYLRVGQAHAPTLVTLLSTATVGSRQGTVIVKRSYAQGATREEIIANPTQKLENITVMFQREAGYDAANQNWFWAMYAPDGAVGRMEGATMAGKVGMCIGCHTTAPGGDFVFLR